MLAASAFVGRTSELDLLDEALEALAEGEPRAVAIAGPAGIGKTRLLGELARRADGRGHVVLSGSGAELEQDLPFWVFVDALDEYVQGIESRRLERLEARVRAELSQVLPAFDTAPAAPGAGGATHERYRTHRAVRELLEQLALSRPLVLVLDDLHWADPASVDLVMALLRRPPAAGVLLVLAARPRQLPSPLAAALDRAQLDGLLVRIELAALTREEAHELVGARAETLYEEAGGNPFYLEQLARGTGAGRAADGAAAPAGVDVPPLVAAALGDELARQPEAARRVLDGASVAGDPFELDLAAAAADLPEAAALDGLDALIAAELVRGTDLPRRFRFRHPIVRRAVYESTPGGWRLAAHERVAALLAARGVSATTRAHHVERSARHGDAEAIATLRAAGAESASRAPATAARWLGAALRLLPGGAPASERVELLLARARALVATGQFDDGHAVLVEALDLAASGPAALRTELAATCARVEHLLGRHEDAHARLVAALEELPDERTVEGVSLLIELTMDRLHRMAYAEMEAWGVRAVDAAASVDDAALRAAALAAAARGAAFPGSVPEARRRADEAAAAIDALPDDVLARRLDALTHLAGAELYLHRLADAHAHAQRALTIGRATGQGQQFPLLFAILGITWYFKGELRDAVEPLDGAVEAARLSGNAQTLAWALYSRSRIALALGDLALALPAAQEAVDIVDDGRPNHHAAHCALALAEANLELGKPERAVELLERSAGGPDMPLAAASFRGLFLEPLVRAHVALGDPAAAMRAVAAARSAAEASGLPLQMAWADRGEAVVALDAGDAPRAAELALAAAAVQVAGGAPVEVARSQVLAGRALAAAGERDRARELLEGAARELERRGADRWRAAAERELRRLGHRVHRRSARGATGESGVAALTRRELEIARLIVDRQTNRQIAEQLFLSTKTVETHIRNIFNKLGADSRVEVARIVEQAERLGGA